MNVIFMSRMFLFSRFLILVIWHQLKSKAWTETIFLFVISNVDRTQPLMVCWNSLHEIYQIWNNKYDTFVSLGATFDGIFITYFFVFFFIYYYWFFLLFPIIGISWRSKSYACWYLRPTGCTWLKTYTVNISFWWLCHQASYCAWLSIYENT